MKRILFQLLLTALATAASLAQCIVELPLTTGVFDGKQNTFAHRNITNYKLKSGESVTFTCANAQTMSALVTEVKGAFTLLKAGRIEADSESVFNESVIFEYQSATQLTIQYTGDGDICVAEVYTGFAPLEALGAGGIRNKSADPYNRYGLSSSCIPFSNAYNTFKDQRNGVARLVVNGTQLGTGTLIAQTGMEQKPMLITAAHVINKPADRLTSIYAFFNYIVEDADNPSAPTDIVLVKNGTLLAFDIYSDIAIIELSGFPSSPCTPYICGWDLSVPSLVSQYVCIHHPRGDAQKISIVEGVKDNVSYSEYNNESKPMREYSHILANEWSVGFTESGSSGALLINANGYGVGTLTGGSSTNCNTGFDYFASLRKAFFKSSHDYKTPSEVLDPMGLVSEDGTGLLRKEGLYYTNSTSTQSFASKSEAVSIRYYSLSGQSLPAKPTKKGLYILVETYADGTAPRSKICMVK